jgi:hypothetical protein
MNSVRYTNIVLTVIAGCLVIIAGRGLGIVRQASAQSAPSAESKPPVQRVVIAGYEAKDRVYYFPQLTFTKDGALRTVDTEFTFNNDGALRTIDTHGSF